MRQEDKEVDGPDIERAEERKRDNELVEEDEEELFDLDGQSDYAHDDERSGAVIAAMNQILEEEHVVIDQLGLPRRETIALEALKTAVEGRDQKLGRFVYAEDRRALLEQALAVLQPDIASLDHLSEPFEQLVERVAGVRERLDQLEDAEEEIIRPPAAALGQEGDTDDKPTPQDDDTSLTGPERAIAKPASSLAGPERAPEAKPASTLSGPARPVDNKPSTLGGPDVQDAPKPPSSLTGPERADPAPPASTLGDAAEIAETQKKKPWWRRPFGG